jgi:hypothetical protein
VVRLAIICSIVLCLVPVVTTSSRANGSFQVGVTIGGAGTATVKQRVVERTYTWGAAALSAIQAGYSNPQPLGRSQTVYWFIAERGETHLRVGVSISSGEIVDVIPE